MKWRDALRACSYDARERSRNVTDRSGREVTQFEEGASWAFSVMADALGYMGDDGPMGAPSRECLERLRSFILKEVERARDAKS